MFTPEQMKCFRTQGYLSAPDFFDAAEVGALQAEIIRLRASGQLRNVATQDDGITAAKEVQNLQICPILDKSPLILGLPFAEKVVAAVAALVGDPLVFRLDQIFLKPARHGSGTSWHQDNAYFQLPDPAAGVGMWIAIHTANAANGTMRIIPGAFETSLPHSRDPLSDHHIRCYPDESRALTIELPAGGALFFNYGVPHCTGGNATDHDRAALALHFYRHDARPELYGSEAVHAMLTGPQATHGIRERGRDLRGAWNAAVQRSESALAR